MSPQTPEQKEKAKAWLEERFPFDEAARNVRVENSALAACQHGAAVRLLDLGAGLGSNVRHYAKLFCCDLDWILVEKSEYLSKASVPVLRTWAEGQGWRVQDTKDSLQIHTPGNAIRVRCKNVSIDEIPDAVSLDGVHLVTANAVMDLLSEDLFIWLVKMLASRSIPLLMTLNYRSTRFFPEDPDDRIFLSLYEAHMQRLQDFGRAMGPHCTGRILGFARKRGIPFSAGKSLWKIHSGDVKLRQFLFSFMELAFSEVASSIHERARWEAWVKKKRQLAANELLALQVDHSDIFMRLDMKALS